MKQFKDLQVGDTLFFYNREFKYFESSKISNVVVASRMWGYDETDFMVADVEGDISDMDNNPYYTKISHEKYYCKKIIITFSVMDKVIEKHYLIDGSDTISIPIKIINHRHRIHFGVYCDYDECMKYVNKDYNIGLECLNKAKLFKPRPDKIKEILE